MEQKIKKHQPIEIKDENSFIFNFNTDKNIETVTKENNNSQCSLKIYGKHSKKMIEIGNGDICIMKKRHKMNCTCQLSFLNTPQFTTQRIQIIQMKQPK